MNKEIEEMLPNIKKMKDYESSNDRCAPSKKFENGSCIDLSDLINLAKIFNRIQPENIIKIQKQHKMLGDDSFKKLYKKWLLNEFKKRFPKCSSETCWITTLLQFNHLLDEEQNDSLCGMAEKTWRPEGPKKINDWLSNFDIIESIEQYYDKYKDFVFLGSVPIDFFTINYPLTPGTIKLLNSRDIDVSDGSPISRLNYKELVSKGFHKFGIVFNLDPHDKPGSHWVGMYADFKKNNIFFFDSYGEKPDKPIADFMDYIKDKMSEIGNRTDIVSRHNTIRHQYGGSECGVYSMNFILRMLRGESFDDIIKAKTPDKEIQQCRYIYFSGLKRKEKNIGKHC